MMKDCKLRDIIVNFNFEGELITSEDHFCGLINDTYFLEFKSEVGQINRYVLQKINTEVFTKPKELMDNISKVTSHISNKVKEEGGDWLRESLNIVKTIDGKNYYENSCGEYWRSFLFINNAQTYMMVEKQEDFYTCGKAIGKFQKYLSDFKVGDLYETIPDFHNTVKRYESFIEAVKRDKVGRASLVRDEINFIITREDYTNKIVELIDIGKIPLRVTHNDTKYNNIMIDDITGEGICVIDLDTVMPGTVLYDFGDAIRSGATTSEEDEVDLSKVNFDINLFEQFTKGFLEAIGSEINTSEVELLTFSCKLITLELAIRFLTDFINGDVYFKVNRFNHNLDRTRNQFKLLLDMEKFTEEMDAIVEKYYYNNEKNSEIDS